KLQFGLISAYFMTLHRGGGNVRRAGFEPAEESLEAVGRLDLRPPAGRGGELVDVRDVPELIAWARRPALEARRAPRQRGDALKHLGERHGEGRPAADVERLALQLADSRFG